MSAALQRLASQVLYGSELGTRTVDQRIQLREWLPSERVILDVGGRWDKVDRCWLDDEARAKIFRVHPGQYEPAYYFADWYRAYARGIPASQREGALRDVYTLLLEGGRGGGKSDLGLKCLVMFAVGCSERIVWAISPSQDETEELRAVIDGLVPCSERIPQDETWFTWLENKQTFFGWNGTMIRCLSGFKPSALKRGRVDMWLLNELQRQARRCYTMARPRLVDTSGLGLATLNPPDEPKGEWTTEFREKIVAGKVTGARVYFLDNKLNPTIDWRGLEILAEELPPDEFRREIMGEYVPFKDQTYYPWRDSVNIKDPPEVGADITRAFTKQKLSRPFDYVAGADFQLAPYMAFEVAKIYADPSDPDSVFLYFVDGIQVKGDEDDLIDAVEATGIYTRKNTAIIGDASGLWQDAARTKGGGSFDMIKRRGWRWIYPPDRSSKRNPPVKERVLAVNSMICNSTGKAKLFGAKSCAYSNRAMRMMENKHGKPNSRSDYAHVCDARGYVVWRFFGRKLRRARLQYMTGGRSPSSFEQDLGEL